jgi:hypothetical protein
MMTNVGVIERVLRLALGLALLGWTHGKFGPPPAGDVAWLAFAGGAFLTFTGLYRHCPLYALMKIDTCAIRGARARKAEPPL